MNIFKKVLLPVVSLMAMSSAAFAAPVGFGVEPYAGYTFAGSFKSGADYPGGTGTNNNFNGFTLGARALVNFEEIFFAGPDFTIIPTSNWDGSASGVSHNNVRLGLVAGVKLPMLFRVWAGYNFIDNQNTSQNNQSTQLAGSSFKLGVGYSILPMLSANAEFLMNKYGKFTDESNKSVSGDIGSGKSFLLSVSAPLSLPL